MSAKVWLAAMVAGSVVVIVAGSRERPDPLPPQPRMSPESPWLSREAAAEIVGPGGSLGPLFAGVTLGGSAPLPAVRERIAEFARANNVEIELEIVDDEVAAVRFEVVYGGCCGYEGADALAARMGRPKTGGSCMRVEPGVLDDWVFANEDGVHVRARVRVNRLMVRWERMATFDELLERADRLLGADRGAASSDAGDRWREIEPGRQYLLEIPYPFLGSGWYDTYPAMQDPGILVQVDRRKIVEVSFQIRQPDEEPDRVPDGLRSHWGRPRIRAGGETWTWRKPDRIVTAGFDPDVSNTTVALRLR
jgi:hypothetical protein